MDTFTEVLGNDPVLGEVQSIVLKSNHFDSQVRIITLGAAITHLYVPNHHHKCTDVVLGFDDWEDYKENNAYLGVVCGRYANRIKNAQFSLNGKEYNLPVNNGPNALHGGLQGLSRKNWCVEAVVCAENEASVTLSCESADGEEGYPGNLKVWVTYTYTNDLTLRIAYRAVSDQDTVLNLTNHTYFNLKGEGAGNILGHFLQMDATQYLELDKDCCPTGNILNVQNTPFDFRKVHDIGFRIYENNQQLKDGKGYDTCFCYKANAGELQRVATLYERASHRRLDVYTDLPAVQIYTGNWLGYIEGKSLYHDYEGVALETQHYPASPNFPEFPSTVIRANEPYSTVTEYRFSTM